MLDPFYNPHDPFYKTADHPADPAKNIYLITPDDINPLPIIPKAIRADAAGAITFRTVDGVEDVTMTFAAGEVLDARVAYVRDTGTDAIAIHALA